MNTKVAIFICMAKYTQLPAQSQKRTKKSIQLRDKLEILQKTSLINTRIVSLNIIKLIEKKSQIKLYGSA